jgi:AcrR family transcriptional regulator
VPASLRERNRERTREELLDVGARLFRARGFSATTVTDIAEEAGIGRRTFFRYFATKEELALAIRDEDQQLFLAHLASRPRVEGPFAALQNAMLETLAHFDGPEGDALVERLVASKAMMAANPTIHAAHLHREAMRQEQAVRILAERLAVDPQADPRPRLWTAVVSAITEVTLAVWLTQHRAAHPIPMTGVFREMLANCGLTDPGGR